MKSNTKKVLKWFGGIAFCILMLIGLRIYTLMCPELGEMNRYSYCYFACISSEIKNAPLIGLKGKPVYNASGLDLNHPAPTTDYCWVRYESNSSLEDTVKETTRYFNSIGFKDSDKSCHEGKSECSDCCWESNRKDSVVRITVTTSKNDISKFDVWIWLDYEPEGTK
jgi:hypothetical protein